jgi:hypothetical protein
VVITFISSKYQYTVLSGDKQETDIEEHLLLSQEGKAALGGLVSCICLEWTSVLSSIKYH